MTRQQDVMALLKEVDNQFLIIKDSYNNALHKKEIPVDLKITIKNYFENAKSSLDYLAHDIAEQLSISGDKIYFPIVGKSVDVKSFEGSVARNLPKLKEKDNLLFNYLESLQPYHSKMSWLGDFVEIGNNNKHQQLTPQARSENPAINISHNNVGMRLSGGSIHLSKGVSISIGGAVIPGGQKISPDSSFVADSRFSVKREIWVSFMFPGNINALGLIQKVKEQLPGIISGCYNLLGRQHSL